MAYLSEKEVHMQVICAWCNKDLGQKEPLEETKVSHGICPICMESLLRQENVVLSVPSLGAISIHDRQEGDAEPSKEDFGRILGEYPASV